MRKFLWVVVKRRLPAANRLLCSRLNVTVIKVRLDRFFLHDLRHGVSLIPNQCEVCILKSGAAVHVQLLARS